MLLSYERVMECPECHHLIGKYHDSSGCTYQGWCRCSKAITSPVRWNLKLPKAKERDILEEEPHWLRVYLWIAVGLIIAMGILLASLAETFKDAPAPVFFGFVAVTVIVNLVGVMLLDSSTRKTIEGLRKVVKRHDEKLKGL